MITIKEEFLSDLKLRRALKLGGHEALTLWLALKAYAAQHGTDGFVPDELLEDLCEGLRIRRPRKTMEALVGCGKVHADGERGAGLVTPVPHGWQLHDYLDHATSGDELEERRSKERERKRLQRDRARLRLALREQGMATDAAEAMVRDMSPAQVRDTLRDTSRDMSRDTGQGRRGTVPRDLSRVGAPAEAPARADARTRPGAPQPSPAQPNLDPGESALHDVPGPSEAPTPPPALSGVGTLRPIGRAHLLNLERSFQRPALPMRDDFEPSEAARDLAQRLGVDLEETVEALRLDSRSKGAVSCDWDADLQRWIRRGAQWQRERAKREAEREARFGRAPGLVEHEDRTAKARADLARYREEFGVGEEVASG